MHGARVSGQASDRETCRSRLTRTAFLAPSRLQDMGFSMLRPTKNNQYFFSCCPFGVQGFMEGIEDDLDQETFRWDGFMA
jgi:hypothetical protein